MSNYRDIELTGDELEEREALMEEFNSIEAGDIFAVVSDIKKRIICECCEEGDCGDCDGLSQEKVNGKWTTLPCQCSCFDNALQQALRDAEENAYASAEIRAEYLNERSWEDRGFENGDEDIRRY